MKLGPFPQPHLSRISQPKFKPNQVDKAATITNSCRHPTPHAFHCVHWNKIAAMGSSLPFPGPQCKREVCSGDLYILSQLYASTTPIRGPHFPSILCLCFKIA